MKKFVKAGLLCCVLFFIIQSCSTDENTEEVENLTEKKSVLKTIKSWGFPQDVIVDKGDYYLVDGDIIFYKNQKYPSLKKTDSDISSKQKKYTSLVSIRDIDVFINSQMDASWISASAAAITRWNEVSGTNLNLRITTTRANAHIEILYDTQDPDFDADPRIPGRQNLPPNAFGMGEFPLANGLPGRTIWINPDFNSNTLCFRPINENMMIANVQHELGHNLGLMHTNQPYGIQINGTPTLDPLSVMNGNQACTINDFSASDEFAIRVLFPAPPPPRLSPTIIYFDARGGYTNNSQPMRVTGSGEVTVTVDGASGIMFRENSGAALKTSLTLTAPANFEIVAFELFRPDLGNRQSFVRLRQNNTITSSCVVYQLGPNN